MVPFFYIKILVKPDNNWKNFAKTKEMLTIMPFKTRVSIKKLSLVFTVSMDFAR